MQLLSPVLFALSSSLDALLLGISYGIRGMSILLWQNLLVSLITLLGTCLSMGFATLLLPVLPDLASLIGGIVVILLGVYYMTKAFFYRLWQNHLMKTGACPELEKSSTTTRVEPQKFIREILLMGAVLSLNNIGIGFSAGIAGLPFLSTAIATLFFSVFFLFLGNKLGQSRLFRFAECFSEPLSGALLILLGIFQLLIQP